MHILLGQSTTSNNSQLSRRDAALSDHEQMIAQLA